MNCFVIEGTIKNPNLIDDNIMKEHIAYSQKAIDEGRIFVSGLKSDMSGGLFIMKAESIEKVEAYLSSDPLKIHGIQEYRIIEFTPHNFQQIASEWFKS